jgi:hypothetical protein
MNWKDLLEKLIQLFLTLLVSIGLISGPTMSPIQVSPITPTPLKSSIAATNLNPLTPTMEAAPTTSAIPRTSTPLPPATPTLSPQTLRPQPGSICGYDPRIAALMEGLDQADWVHWVEVLSGEKPVQLNGETYQILTRYSESMFTGNPKARAYEFVLEQLHVWGYQDGVDLFEQEYRPTVIEFDSTWKNIIVLIPGKDPELSQEQTLLTAHLDSISIGNPEERAPGADDNGSGVATLLEAARTFRSLEFKRTIKIVFFTGEEQGLWGSQAYTSRYAHELDDILGVINLDMFGYDSDNDRCFEIHVGWMPESNIVGGCLADVIEGYPVELNVEYIVQDALRASDHASFWDQGVGAIEVLENFSDNGFPYGCGEQDFNPYYHTDKDLIEHMNLDTGHAIAKAAIGAAASLAEIIGD